MSLILPRILILSLILVSLEAMSDLDIGDLLHNDDQSHLKEFGHGLSSHGGELSDEELDGEHCQHCCHGHTSSISGHLTAMNCDVTDQRFSIYEPHILNFAQAPPTPPPNV